MTNGDAGGESAANAPVPAGSSSRGIDELNDIVPANGRGAKSRGKYRMLEDNIGLIFFAAACIGLAVGIIVYLIGG